MFATQNPRCQREAKLSLMRVGLDLVAKRRKGERCREVNRQGPVTGLEAVQWLVMDWGLQFKGVSSLLEASIL